MICEFMVYSSNEIVRTVSSLSTGCFFPEEDDQFVERVRAAVEEEERQAAAARNTSAAAAAILNAEEARKAAAGIGGESDSADHQERGGELGVPAAPNNPEEELDKQSLSQQTSHDEKTGALSKETPRELPKGADGLPAEFYHYYFGSSFDMGALIEVHSLPPVKWLIAQSRSSRGNSL